MPDKIPQPRPQEGVGGAETKPVQHLQTTSRHFAPPPISFELSVEDASYTSRAITLGLRPVAIGRGPDNDLVVPDPLVSWHHARVWADHGAVWCADAGSRNGTFVNGRVLRSTERLTPGDELSIGQRLTLRVRSHGLARVNTRPRTWAVEEVGSGLRYPFRAARFTIGSASDADLRLSDARPYHVEFAVHAPNDVWVLVDTEDHPVALGDEFVVNERTFRLVQMEMTEHPTLVPHLDRFPYRLMADLNGPLGPEARVEDPRTEAVARIGAETRATLLYVLGRKLEEHRATREVGDAALDEAGWCTTEEAVVAVWGRAGLSDGNNRLKVLVHRLRKELAGAGIDPAIIERRQGHIRVRVRSFQLLEASSFHKNK